MVPSKPWCCTMVLWKFVGMVGIYIIEVGAEGPHSLDCSYEIYVNATVLETIAHCNIIIWSQTIQLSVNLRIVRCMYMLQWHNDDNQSSKDFIIIIIVID